MPGRRPRRGRRSGCGGEALDARLVANVVLVGFVVTVIYTDWRWRRIPNAVTYPTMLIGIALGAWEALPGQLFVDGLLDHVAGLVVALMVSYPFYAAGGIKAGDGKLLMAVGALRGVVFLLRAAFYGALVGGLIALVFLAARRLTPVPDGEAPRTMGRLLHTWIPYGIALGAGALIALTLG